MRNLTDKIIKIAERTSSAIVFFSSGKDSIVTLDLCFKYLKHIQLVHLYYVKDLQYRLDYFAKIKAIYGVDVLQFPHEDLINLRRSHQGKGKIKQSENEFLIQSQLKCKWIAKGLRKDDSLQRRGIINSTAPNGYDEKKGVLYPLSDWSEGHVMAYLKANKLPLPIEYSYNFRDFNNPLKEQIEMLKDAGYHSDIEKIYNTYPYLRVKHED
jgi:phosphoadenosine phosphosulfate reductase